MRESKVGHFMIVLRQSVDCSFLRVVPDNDVRVFTTLACRKHVSISCDSDACNRIVMGCQEMLVVWVLNITDHD